MRFDAPYFNEFIVTTPGSARALRDALVDKGFVAGVPLDRYYAGMDDALLLAVTETASRKSIDALVEALAASGRQTA